MNRHDNPLYWSASCGTWLATQIRISVWFPLLLLSVVWRLGWELGLTFSAILFVSVLLHEFGHVIAARLTGGAANEILLWPLGGLAYTQPANTFRSHFLTSAGGPLVNATLCLMTLPAVLQSGDGIGAFNPFVFPDVDLKGDPVHAVLLMTFFANWLSLLLNLIPVYPLDGGQMLKAILSAWYGRESSSATYVLIGFVAAVIMLVVGLGTGNTWLTVIGALVFVMNSQESLQMRMSETYDESFMGYDFSQGYTSLERSSSETQAPPAKPGMLQRWRERREAERMRRESEQTTLLQQQVDSLLEKVHLHGIDSLTSSERQTLKQASQRLRDKGKPAE